MTNMIQTLDGDDGLQYLIRAENLDGTVKTPEEILRSAQQEAQSDGMVVTSTLDEIRVYWVKAVPCHPDICGDHNVHYNPMPGKTRGAFEAAYVDIRCMDDADSELEAYVEALAVRSATTVGPTSNLL
jgi:hypothetical protein